MTAYYNDNDQFAAAWLRELIAAGAIAPGDVDTRDIRDVRPADLRGYTQVHCFAGIGVWSFALRLAGWPDDQPVWTGSCPCQPFSAAGKRSAFADERHLWPAWHHLIRECRPAKIFGEQVASNDGLAWLDNVQADLEGAGYACGALDSCAAGVGAPHIRQRLWIAAERLGLADDARLEGYAGYGDLVGQRRWLPPQSARPLAATGGARRLADTGQHEFTTLRREPAAIGGGGGGARRIEIDVAASHGRDGGLADDHQVGRPEFPATRRLHDQGPSGHDADGRRGPRGVDDAVGIGRPAWRSRHHAGDERIQPGPAGPAGGLVDPGGGRLDLEQGKPGEQGPEGFRGHKSLDRREAGGVADAAGGLVPLEERRPAWRDGPRPAGAERWTGPVNGHWAAADWLFCRDGRWRPVEPETLPLAHGVTGRVGRLRGYGNALVAPAAAAFIAAARGSFRMRGEGR